MVVSDCIISYTIGSLLPAFNTHRKRLWIWQEVVLPKSSNVTFQAGRARMSWDNARGGITLLSILSDQWPQTKFSNILTPALMSPREKFCTTKSGLHPLNLIDATRNAMYTVTHDRIYALLGLMSPDLVKLIHVDYTVPVLRVAREFCLAIASRHRSLQFLTYCDLDDQRDEVWSCSWVPNLFISSRFTNFTTLSSMKIYDRICYLEGEYLVVSGVLCGTVQQVAKPTPTKGNLQPVLKSWEKIAKEQATNENIKSWKREFVEVLQGGEVAENYPSRYSHKSLTKCLMRYELNRTKPPLVSDCILGRSLFVLDDNKIGLCSPSVRKGTSIIFALTTISDSNVLRGCIGRYSWYGRLHDPSSTPVKR